MGYFWMVIMSLSVLPASVAGVAKYRQIDPRYYPLVLMMWLGLANELLSYFLISKGFSNIVNVNIYLLAEALLILWQFKNWEFGMSSRSYGFVGGGLIFLWATESFLNAPAIVFSSVFRLCYCGLTIAMAVKFLYELFDGFRGRLIKDARFLFCGGFIIYFSVNLLVEIFLMDVVKGSPIFRDLLFGSATLVNLAVNFIYLIAILCIPKKPQFLRA
jgi:hypothetical protein